MMHDIASIGQLRFPVVALFISGCGKNGRGVGVSVCSTADEQRFQFPHLGVLPIILYYR